MSDRHRMRPWCISPWTTSAIVVVAVATGCQGNRGNSTDRDLATITPPLDASAFADVGRELAARIEARLLEHPDVIASPHRIAIHVRPFLGSEVGADAARSAFVSRLAASPRFGESFVIVSGTREESSASLERFASESSAGDPLKRRNPQQVAQFDWSRTWTIEGSAFADVSSHLGRAMIRSNAGVTATANRTMLVAEDVRLEFVHDPRWGWIR